MAIFATQYVYYSAASIGLMGGTTLDCVAVILGLWVPLGALPCAS